MNKISSFTIFSFILMLSIIMQILLGSLVRITDSGLSCPDWPLCYGLWFPSREELSAIKSINYQYYQIMLEWFHRLNVVLLIVPLYFTLLIKSIFQYLYLKNKKIIFIMGIIIVFQSFLGGFTVIDKNSAWSVAIHLSFALILLLLSVLVFLNSITIEISHNYKHHKFLQLTLILSLFLVFCTIIMGAIVSKTGSALACVNWPLCNESIYLINIDYQKIIHLLHRILAIFTTISIFCIAILHNNKKHKFNINILYRLPIIIVCLQVIVGALVVISGVSFFYAVLHQILGLILFLIISILIYLNSCKFILKK